MNRFMVGIWATIERHGRRWNFIGDDQRHGLRAAGRDVGFAQGRAARLGQLLAGVQLAHPHQPKSGHRSRRLLPATITRRLVGGLRVLLEARKVDYLSRGGSQDIGSAATISAEWGCGERGQASVVKARYVSTGMPIAAPDTTIDAVLPKFLDAQRERLSSGTFRKYEEVVELLRHCLEGYALPAP